MPSSRKQAHGFRRQPRIADQMTADLYRCVERSLAAERAGEVQEALEWHRAVPMFRRSRHTSLLDRLAHLGDELPSWVWVRWIAYQVVRCEDGETREVVRTALSDAVELLHGDLMEACFGHGGDPIRVAAQVLGESWAYHQRAVHDLGGMQSFLDEHATGRLAGHRDLALRWADSPMGGFELGDSLPGARLRVRPATGGAWMDVLDLGARSGAPYGWVIGRLVPSSDGSPPMFDMPPLGVPQAVAVEVAGCEDWFDAIVGAVEDGRLPAASFLREDYELTTDVGELDLLRFGTRPHDLPRVMQQLREGRDEIRRAAFRVLARASRGEVDAADQAYVAAAVQNVKAYDDARRKLVGPGLAGAWRKWVDLVEPPARQLLRSLAEH